MYAGLFVVAINCGDEQVIPSQPHAQTLTAATQAHHEELLPKGNTSERSAALDELRPMSPWQAVTLRASLLHRRGQHGVVTGTLAALPGEDDLRIVDELTGAGALAIRTRALGTAAQPGMRVAARGAWLAVGREWAWRVSAWSTLPTRSDPHGETGERFAPLPALIAPATDDKRGAIALPSRKRPGAVFFQVVSAPTRPGEGWLIAHRSHFSPEAMLYLPGEAAIYGAQDYTTPSERWQLQRGVTYITWVKEVAAAYGDELRLLRAAWPPAGMEGRATMSPRKKIAIACGLAVVTAVGAWWLRRSDHAKSSEQAPSVNGAPRALHVASLDPRKRPVAAASGTVRSLDGKPIANAQVCAAAYSAALTDADTREPLCTATDPSGVFSFKQLVPANYSFAASAHGFLPGAFTDASGEDSVMIASGESRSDIAIVLASGGVEVTGTVSDIGGGPIADATITLRSGSGFFGNSPAQVIVRSDAEGRFRAWLSEGRLTASADAQGYSRAYKQAVAPGMLIAIELVPEAVLSGVVVDAATGDRVLGALVTAQGDDGGGSARSDEQGRFRIEGLQPGRYSARAEIMGKLGHGYESTRIGLGETAELTIELHAVASLKARVLIGETGVQPCTAGMVSMWENKTEHFAQADIERDGTVLLSALLPGEYRVTVACQNFVELTPPPLVVGEESTSQEWRVSAGATLRGIVRDDAGSPVASASLLLTRNPGRERVFARSDRGGVFRLQGVLPGEYSVMVDAPGLMPPAEEPKVAIEVNRENSLEVTLERGGGVRGRVLEQSGTPVAGVRVGVGGRRGMGGGQDIFTNDAGEFELRGLPPGPTRVKARRGTDIVRSAGTGESDLQGVVVEIVSGQVADVDIVVESQREWIAGTVVDDKKQPVADAFVVALRESESAGAAAWRRQRSRWTWGADHEVTGADGRFTIENLAPGAYTVRAYRRGGGEAFAESVKSGSDIQLSISQESSITGVVQQASGGFPQQFSIAISDPASGFSRGESFFRTQGRWRISDVPAGSYIVTARAAEGTGEAMVTIAVGVDQTVPTITLAARATIVGRVVHLATGQPLGDFRVGARQVKGGDASYGSADDSNITQADGRFTLKDAPIGRVQIWASPANWGSGKYGFARTVRTVEAGSTVDVGDIRVPEARIARSQAPGDLGFAVDPMPPGSDPDSYVLRIASVRSGGPAAVAGLVVGDVIISIDGYDVTGPNSYLYWSLSNVLPNTTLKITTQAGKQAAVTAGPPA